MFMTWRDLTTASLCFGLTYPHVCGVVRINRPQLRFGIGRNNHHFSSVEDAGVANYFGWLTASLNDAELDSNICRPEPLDSCLTGSQPHESYEFPPWTSCWQDCAHIPIHQNVGLLRRTARWQSERTMEHYLHEATYALQGVTLPRETEHLR